MAVIVEQQTICQRYALDHDEVFDGAFQRQKEILLQIVPKQPGPKSTILIKISG